jgi:hypothetical protein
MIYIISDIKEQFIRGLLIENAKKKKKIRKTHKTACIFDYFFIICFSPIHDIIIITLNLLLSIQKIAIIKIIIIFVYNKAVNNKVIIIIIIIKTPSSFNKKNKKRIRKEYKNSNYN